MDLEELYRSLSFQDIEEYIAIGQEENLYIDFKLLNSPSLDRREDRKTFAKALSGFANSSGGLIIWGVDARKNEYGIDCACDGREIQPLSLFISKLNKFTGEFASPIIDGVQHKRISTQDDKGYAVTFVPPSDAGPHMAKAGEDRYYKRSGDSFYKMEHFDIEDMFGRRKRPLLSLKANIQPGSITTSGNQKHYRPNITLIIENIGRGSARSIYIALRFESGHKIRRQTGFILSPLLTVDKEKICFGGSSDIVVHPGTHINLCNVEYEVSDSNASPENIVIHYDVIAEDTRMRHDILQIIGSDILSQLE
ncbi:MAG: ATP-binding protein [Cyanobacteria bacterium P01_D01_bin.156]